MHCTPQHPGEPCLEHLLQGRPSRQCQLDCLKLYRVEEVWGMDNFHLCADYLEVDVIAEGDNSITLQTRSSGTVHELSILGYDR